MVESGSSNTTKISMQVVGWRQNLAAQTHCLERNQDSLADHIGLSSIYLCCPVKLPSKKEAMSSPPEPKISPCKTRGKNDIGKNGRRETNGKTGLETGGFFPMDSLNTWILTGLTLLFITGLGFLSLSHDASGKKVKVKNKEPGKSSKFRIEMMKNF